MLYAWGEMPDTPLCPSQATFGFSLRSKRSLDNCSTCATYPLSNPFWILYTAWLSENGKEGYASLACDIQESVPLRKRCNRDSCRKLWSIEQFWVHMWEGGGGGILSGRQAPSREVKRRTMPASEWMNHCLDKGSIIYATTTYTKKVWESARGSVAYILLVGERNFFNKGSLDLELLLKVAVLPQVCHTFLQRIRFIYFISFYFILLFYSLLYFRSLQILSLAYSPGILEESSEWGASELKYLLNQYVIFDV